MTALCAELHTRYWLTALCFLTLTLYELPLNPDHNTATLYNLFVAGYNLKSPLSNCVQAQLAVLLVALMLLHCAFDFAAPLLPAL
jgi:hypothetical protein